MLRDRFGRSIEYLRLSVTDRCDLRCTYCMPTGFKGFEEPADWLSFDEIDDLSMSTNATQLRRHAAALRQAGVRRINVSLDTLDRACMLDITGRDSHAQVMDGIMAGKEAGFDPIKINMVAMRGVNEGEIERMAEFSIEHGFVLPLIEVMPLGATGRNTAWLDLQPVRRRLTERFDLEPQAIELGGGPARYLCTRDGKSSIGFITPMSQHFCATCNRVRLSVDGTRYLCLGQEERFEFRPLLRADASDAELETAIRQAIELKPQQHDFTRRPEKIVRFMSQTGG